MDIRRILGTTIANSTTSEIIYTPPVGETVIHNAWNPKAIREAALATSRIISQLALSISILNASGKNTPA